MGFFRIRLSYLGCGSRMRTVARQGPSIGRRNNNFLFASCSFRQSSSFRPQPLLKLSVPFSFHSPLPIPSSPCGHDPVAPGSVASMKSRESPGAPVNPNSSSQAPCSATPCTTPPALPKPATADQLSAAYSPVTRWNTTNLPLRVGADALSAAGASLMVAPFIATIDRYAAHPLRFSHT
jgi:hypothetical protein